MKKMFVLLLLLLPVFSLQASTANLEDFYLSTSDEIEIKVNQVEEEKVIRGLLTNLEKYKDLIGLNDLNKVKRKLEIELENFQSPHKNESIEKPIFAKTEISSLSNNIEIFLPNCEINPKLFKAKQFQNKRAENVEFASYDSEELFDLAGNHPFLAELLIGFCEHYPVVITPDQIWNLILQGISEQVLKNPEKYRKVFVDHAGKKELVVRRDDFRKGQKNPWNEVVDSFFIELSNSSKEAKKIELKFTTSTNDDLIVQKLSIMNIHQAYFKFKFETFCGIPKIILKGSPEDWQKVKNGLKILEKLDLGWWKFYLDRILDNFILSSLGRAKVSFWKSIFKFHSISGGNKVSGWICLFFPYMRDSDDKTFLNPLFDKTERNPVKIDYFPPGIAKIPFTWLYLNSEIKMEFFGGFVGLKQHNDSKAIEAILGWGVNNKKE